MDRLSPSGQMLAVIREQFVEYLTSHPQKVSTTDLINKLDKQADQLGLPRSSKEFGDAGCFFMTRREAYSCILWDLRGADLLLTERGTYKQRWHEHVSESESEKWR